jgi:hypothetical protein
MLIPKLLHELKNKLINMSKLPPGNLFVKNKTTKQWTISGAMSLMEICLSKQ